MDCVELYRSDMTVVESFVIKLLVWLSCSLNQFDWFGQGTKCDFSQCDFGHHNVIICGILLEMKHKMRFYSNNLFPRLSYWAVMTCYDNSISQNIHIFCYYSYNPQASQTVSHPSFLLTQTCARPHTHTNYNKAGLTEGSGLFIYCCPSFVCTNVCGLCCVVYSLCYGW